MLGIPTVVTLVHVYVLSIRYGGVLSRYEASMKVKSQFRTSCAIRRNLVKLYILLLLRATA